MPHTGDVSGVLKASRARRASKGEAKVKRSLVVVGMGYIGLPTAVVLAENGWQVTGVDINPAIVESINRGELPFVEAELGGHLAKVVADGALHAQAEPPEASVYIVAVPTPFGEGHEADLSYIFAAVDSIAPKLKPGAMIILESTSPVGTTEKMMRRALELRPDLAGDGTFEGAKICAAHAPERVLPGHIMKEMTANDRIVGGLTPRATDRAAAVYASFCEGEILRTDAATAELAKLTENAFRDVNIAFANELSLICDGYGINVRELISLANKHPRVNILQPGPGVGGHCIAVDPWFIVSGNPARSHLIRTAREVNDSKPKWVMAKFEEMLSECEASATVVILGLAFKANVDDLRESPAMEITHQLAERYPERHFLALEPNIRELPQELAVLGNVEHTRDVHCLDHADAALVLVGHRQFRSARKFLPEGAAVLDTIGLWMDGAL